MNQVSDSQVTGEAIPRRSLLGKAMLYVEHVTGRTSLIRFAAQGLLFLLFRECPTILGTYVRPVIYGPLFGSIGKGCLFERSVRVEVPSRVFVGDRVVLGQNCWISAGGKEGEIRFGRDTFVAHSSTLRGEGGRMAIGDHVQISRNCYINAAGGVEIGDDTMLGPNAVIVSVNHLHDRFDLLIRKQEVAKKKVVIENDVWLGANTSVLPGVTIGKGSVVGAGAVVTKDIPPFSLAVGIPAKVVGKRDSEGKQEA
jgi:acetyltransferase-like isoleucine patch superfamily enzyme